MELKSTFLDTSFVVEIQGVVEFQHQILIDLGYVQMPLYWQINNLAHTLGNLLLLRKIEIDCVDGHSPEEGYAIVQRKMQMIADVVRKVERGGAPRRFDPRKDYLPTLSKGGQVTSLGDAPFIKRSAAGRSQ